MEVPLDTEAPAWMSNADALIRGSDWEGARAELLGLRRDHPQEPELWIRLAFVELQLGNPEAAVQASQQAYDVDPSHPDALLMLAQCQAQVGHGEISLELLEEGLQDRPEDRRLLELSTTLALGMQEWPKAAGLLRQLIRLYPEESAYWLDLGRLLLNSADVDGAVEAFRKAAELGADAALTQAMEGKAQLAAGRHELALDAFRRSNALRPNSDALGGEATVHFLRGERGLAIQTFRRAIDLAPEDADLRFNLGNVLVQTERFEEAEEAFRTSLRLDPQSPSAHLNLAVLLLNRFAVSEAEQHLRWATQLDPQLPKPYLHLGRIAGALYDYDSAIESYRRYRELVNSAPEESRIDTVITELRRLAEQSRAALARGEVHLLQLKVKSEELARDIIERVRRGEDFYVIAEQESELADVTGVDTGFLDPTAVSPLFRDAIERLGRGEMTPPIEAENGYYVFRRVE